MAANRRIGPTWLIVDGYNIIGAWSFLKEKPNIQDARDALIDILMDHCGYQNYRLLLVFDAAATADPVHEERLLSKKSHRIIFTDSGQTADQYIERFVRDHEKEEMIVASSDQLIQVMVFSRAVRMSARELYIAIEESRKSIEERAEQLKTSTIRLDARIQEDVAKKLELWRLGQYEHTPSNKKQSPSITIDNDSSIAAKQIEDHQPRPKKRRRRRKKHHSNAKESIHGKSKNNDTKQ